jgi:hypothetical protein
MDTLVVIRDPADQSPNDALRRLGLHYTGKDLIKFLKQKRNTTQQGGLVWAIGGVVVRDAAGRLVSVAAAAALQGAQAGAVGGPAGVVSGAVTGVVVASTIYSAWLVWDYVTAARAVGGGSSSNLSEKDEFINALKHRIGDCNLQILASLVSEMNVRDQVPYGAMTQTSLLKAALHLKLMLEPQILATALKDQDAALNKLLGHPHSRKNKTLHATSARSRSAAPRSARPRSVTARRRN